MYRQHVSGELPFALGRDLAGVVEEVGPQVTLWEPGDPVWAAVPFWKPGTLAEYVVLDEKEVSTGNMSCFVQMGRTRCQYPGCIFAMAGCFIVSIFLRARASARFRR